MGGTRIPVMKYVVLGITSGCRAVCAPPPSTARVMGTALRIRHRPPPRGALLEETTLVQSTGRVKKCRLAPFRAFQSNSLSGGFASFSPVFHITCLSPKPRECRKEPRHVRSTAPASQVKLTFTGALIARLFLPWLQPLFYPTHLSQRCFLKGFQAFYTKKKKKKKSWLTHFSRYCLLNDQADFCKA